MALITLTSASGSPGVTTTAVGMSTCRIQRRDENVAMALPASKTMRMSWRRNSWGAHRRIVSGRRPWRIASCGPRLGNFNSNWPVRVVPAAAAIMPTKTRRCCSPGMNESLVAASTRPETLSG